MTEMMCLASIGNLISNLGDMILWYALDMPVMEWMRGALYQDFNVVMENCKFD